MDIQSLYGNIDVYLFDQLLKGRLQPGMAVLDAGCGGGRNLVYLMRAGFNVHGVDSDPTAIEQVRSLAASLAPQLPAENFAVAPAESLPHSDAQFDFVICNALLHFARDEDHFHAMVGELARVLKPAGIFFARLMSTHGVETIVQPLGGRRYRLPGGQPVFLVDEELIMNLTRDVFHGRLIDPLKSTLVHNQRTMTTWVLMRES